MDERGLTGPNDDGTFVSEGQTLEQNAVKSFHGSQRSKKRTNYAHSVRVDTNAKTRAADRKAKRNSVLRSLNEANPFVHKRLWSTIRLLRARWAQISNSFFGLLVSCALCGATAFENQASTFQFVSKSELAPYAVANMFMARFCQDFEQQRWRLCSACASARANSQSRTK
jgi:hypothetical protein